MQTPRNVLSYLEKSAQRHPAKAAVVDEHRTYSYERLHELSRRVGSALASVDGPGRPTIILMEKGIDALCAFFGTLYAGGFYVPVDPNIPRDRLAAICTALDNPRVIVNQGTKELAMDLLPSSDCIRIERLKDHPVCDEVLDAIRRNVIDTDPAYLLFTSGSTGVPKGVAVSHLAIVDFIDTFVELFNIEEDDRIANQAPFDFDVSVKDIYSTMAAGATLVIVPRGLFSRPADLLDYLNAHRVTTMIWAVSALCLVSGLHGLDYKGLPSVRKVLFSGEVMPNRHLKTWMERLPHALFANLYGPTEVTCNCTYHVLDRDRDYSEGIPLGEAFPNRQVFLIDIAGRKVVEPNTLGEVCVRGTSLALGYYGDSESTQAAFVQNPFQTFFPEYVYRTGDLARYSAQGELFFHGRKDNQVKYLGHRVELEEVDIVIERHAGVSRCRCAYDAKRKRICAFYEGDTDERVLRHEMERRLPAYMIPPVMKRVEDMPLTKNGKVDRTRLLQRS